MCCCFQSVGNLAVICLSMPLLDIVIVSKPCCDNRMPWKINSKLLLLFLMQLSFAYRLYWLRSVYEIYAISHYIPFNKLTSVFYASVLLLIINFVIAALWIHSYFDNVMMKFMINNRRDALETNVNLVFLR